MNEPVPPLELRECRYVILFRASQGTLDAYEHGYQAVVELDEIQRAGGTFPLGLDRSCISILPGLWYCLHLPRSRYDFLKAPLSRLKVLHQLDVPQHIVLVPVPLPAQFNKRLTDVRPTVVIVQDDVTTDSAPLISAMGNVIAVTKISELCERSLSDHWGQIGAAFGINSPPLRSPSRLIADAGLRPTWLPAMFVARSLYADAEQHLLPHLRSLDDLLRVAIEDQALISAHFRLAINGGQELEGPNVPEVDLEIDRAEFISPIALAVPGLSPASIAREARENWTQAEEILHASDGNIEHSILGFLVAHRALARNGIGLVTGEMGDEAFVLLDQLESHWASGKPKPRFVWRVLRRLGEYFENCLTSQQKVALSHAAETTCFSEFPIGLAILPGRSSPLACGFPMVYRPLVPLTRATGLECLRPPTFYLRDRLRILIVECLAKEDPVGRLSRVGWSQAIRIFSDVQGGEIQVEEVASIGQFNLALAKKSYDILVISAHGVKLSSQNRTGFICGQDIVMGDELKNLPPIVCLSACQVSPRGHGTVNVSDLLFRCGAMVVIGTLVPIDVRHNAVLMARFFANIAATMNGTEKRFRTLQHIWHFTTTYNAFNDVLSANDSLRAWGAEKHNGVTVAAEFMTTRAKLRAEYIYEDTVARLEEIAQRRGIHSRFRSWIDSQGYLPESAFYVLMGWPERFVFNDPLIAKLSAQSSGN